MRNLIYHFDGFFSSFFYIMICWHVFKLLISSFYLHIWFPFDFQMQMKTKMWQIYYYKIQDKVQVWHFIQV